MKKLLTALAVTALGITMATVVSLAGNHRVYADANPCIRVMQQDNGKGITFNDNKTKAKSMVKVENGCGDSRTLVMKTWYAPSAFQDTEEYHNQQWLGEVGKETVVNKNDNNWTQVDVSMFDTGCFYQVDLVDVTGNHSDVVAAITGGNKDCRPIPTYSCTTMSVDQPAARTARVTNFAFAAQNATLDHVMLTWDDGTSSQINGNPTGAQHKYGKDGNFNIQAIAYFSHRTRLHPEAKVVEAATVNPACAGHVSFTPPTPGTQLVCEIATRKIVTIPEGQYDTTKYAPTDSEKCKDVTITVTSTPGTPQELVHTGPGSVAALFGGVTALAAGARAFVLRRRS